MSGVTIGDVGAFLALLAGIIGSGGVIVAFGAKLAQKWLGKALEPTNDKLDDLRTRLDSNTMDTCKNFIVEFLAKFECDSSKRSCPVITPEEIERFWENYDLYTKMGGNSYIHSKVEQLKNQGRL